MKKLLAMVLILVLALSAACAETPAADTSVFETMAGLEWTFCSGAGAWSTDLWIRTDGEFTGEFHDSDMGDIGDEYPDGTLYICFFSGHMSLVEQVDANTWKIRVDELRTEQMEDTVSGGIHYVPSEPYGISEGDEMLLYGPGTPVSVFSEDMLFWTHVQEEETPPEELPNWFLCSEKNESGFVGYKPATVVDPE